MPKLHDSGPSGYDDSQLTCRTNQHAYTREHWVPVKPNGWDRHLTCIRCGTVKIVQFTRDLVLIKSSMRYPDGYLTARGTKFSRTEARLERIRRLRSVR